MMKSRVLAVLFCGLLLSLFGFSGVSLGQDIKARMKARLPDITVLKAQGVVGENNKGLLEFLGKHRDKEEVIKAENADRQEVYSTIAGKQGTSAELVGKRRALQIAEKAQAGEWIQNEAGMWYQAK
jgi:uncharacterized protein YdbL (DUF1318 family)